MGEICSTLLQSPHIPSPPINAAPKESEPSTIIKAIQLEVQIERHQQRVNHTLGQEKERKRKAISVSETF